MSRLMSLLIVVLAALTWLSALVCAHDAVSGDSAGGGLARSLLVPSLVLYLLALLALAWSRGRGGVPLTWTVLLAALAIAVVGGAAAVSVIFAAPLVKSWATMAQVTLAGQGLLLMLLVWRGTDSLAPRSPGFAVMAVLALVSVVMVLPTRRAYAAALEQIRAERAADDAAARVPR